MPSLLLKAISFFGTRAGGMVATHIALAIAVMMTTIYAMNTLHIAEKAEAAMKAEKQMKAAVERAITQEHKLREVEEGILSGHLERLQREAEQVRVVEKEVIKYVETNPECNLSRGAVRLLNDRRGAFGVTEAGEEAGSKLSDEEAQAASAFTQRAEVEAHARCATRYNRISGQLIGLIRWVDANQELSNEKVTSTE